MRVRVLLIGMPGRQLWLLPMAWHSTWTRFQELTATSEWATISDRCRAVAEASSGLSGNTLKDLIYQRLADLMDRPHRQVIK